MKDSGFIVQIYEGYEWFDYCDDATDAPYLFETLEAARTEARHIIDEKPHGSVLASRNFRVRIIQVIEVVKL